MYSLCDCGTYDFPSCCCTITLFLKKNLTNGNIGLHVVLAYRRSYRFYYRSQYHRLQSLRVGHACKVRSNFHVVPLCLATGSPSSSFADSGFWFSSSLHTRTYLRQLFKQGNDAAVGVPLEVLKDCTTTVITDN